MVNAILGLAAAGEEDAALNSGTAPGELSLLKTNIAGPLAAIGDKFFWSTLRPFVALLSIALLLVFYGDPGMKGSWLAPIFFVLTYNIIILPFRYWSMIVSYKYRNRIVRFLANIEFQEAINIVRYAGLSVALILVGYYFVVFSGGFKEALLYLLAFIIFILMADLRMPPEVMVYIALVISTGITLVVK